MSTSSFFSRQIYINLLLTTSSPIMTLHKSTSEKEKEAREKNFRAKKRESLRSAVINLYRSGMAPKFISEQLQMSIKTVYWVIARYKNNSSGVLEDAPRSGRPSIITPKIRINVIKQIETGESTSAKETASTIIKFGLIKSLSPSTVRNILRDDGMYTIKKMKKPLLSDSHKKARLEWCLNHQLFTEEDWLKVIFSDETTIQVHRNNCNQRVWVRKGFKIENRMVHGTLKYGKGKIMVWGAICKGGISYCESIDGTLDSNGYIGVLDRCLQRTASHYGMGADYIFQQDNAPCHTAKKTLDWFQSKKIQLLPWPAQSPDLNPIENIWHIIKTLVYKRREMTKPAEVWEAFQDEYEKITSEITEKLIRSMPRRLEACIKNEGGYTKY